MLNYKENDTLVVEKKESNAEATNRITNELRTETKLNERRDVVMNYFLELTGIPMTEQQFQKYNELFNKAESGYNIKSFIRDEHIIIDNKTRTQTIQEFNKEHSITSES